MAHAETDRIDRYQSRILVTQPNAVPHGLSESEREIRTAAPRPASVARVRCTVLYLKMRLRGEHAASDYRQIYQLSHVCISWPGWAWPRPVAPV